MERHRVWRTIGKLYFLVRYAIAQKNPAAFASLAMFA
jgi:hypothetical protein